MKIFYIAIFILCTVSVYSQTTIAKDTGRENNGRFSFANATITIRNNKTKTDLFIRTFNDTASLKGLEELPLAQQPVFLSAHIQSGILTACTLWNDGKDYNVMDEGRLLSSAVESENDSSWKEEEAASRSYYLPSQYSLIMEGNKATFTFRKLYGYSLYDFTLESSICITLIRDEPFNQTL